MSIPTPSAFHLPPALMLAVLFQGAPAPAQAAKEPVLLSLKDTAATEVQSQGFTLPQDMKIHVYAKGGSAGDRPYFAYGWILNATTREVVWQMDGRTSKREGFFQVADAYLTLPKGSYEAYFSNHGFAQRSFLSFSDHNIDRRPRSRTQDHGDSHERWFQGMIHGFSGGSAAWERRVGNYGMEVYLPGHGGSTVQTFKAPLVWKHELAALIPEKDGSRLTASFHVKRPVTLHVYAQGEYAGDHEFADHGWILDARTRRPVWEMDSTKAQYGGGAKKNRRQVETLQLPPGDYIANYGTDGSHSPADWNSAPPCDPLRYGLILSVPSEADQGQVALAPAPDPDPILAELVRLGNHRDERASFTLQAPAKVRVYALGERDDEDMADTAWIEDAQGKSVWTMTPKATQHAGGASKNRVADEVISLPKGTFTLHVRTDGSHAYARWNDSAPWDADHYGATVYAAK